MSWRIRKEWSVWAPQTPGLGVRSYKQCTQHPVLTSMCRLCAKACSKALLRVTAWSLLTLRGSEGRVWGAIEGPCRNQLVKSGSTAWWFKWNVDKSLALGTRTWSQPELAGPGWELGSCNSNSKESVMWQDSTWVPRKTWRHSGLRQAPRAAHRFPSPPPPPTFLLIPSLVSCGGRALCEPWNSSYMLLNEEPRTPLGPDTYLFWASLHLILYLFIFKWTDYFFEQL